MINGKHRKLILEAIKKKENPNITIGRIIGICEFTDEELNDEVIG